MTTAAPHATVPVDALRALANGRLITPDDDDYDEARGLFYGGFDRTRGNRSDGQILHADGTSHPDLFWALRGGGGNFGVVTGMCFRLNEVDEIVGGMLVLPAAPDLLVRFMALAQDASEELSTIAAVMPAPPLPFVPVAHHGQMVVFALVCYAGPVEDGEAALAPFRALAEPITDMVRPMRYPEVYLPDEEDYHPTAVGRTMFMDRVDRDVAETILGYLEASDAPMRVAQLCVLGGAMARVPVDATAFAHRSSRIMANVAAFYEGADDRPDRQSWVAAFAAALRQSDPGAYVGFLADEGEARAPK